MTVDGADFRIKEQRKRFDPKWYSHKSNGPAVRYEVGICIQTGWICWINGPFPAGTWTDLRISRECLVDELKPWELLLADNGYSGAYHERPQNNRYDPQTRMASKA